VAPGSPGTGRTPRLTRDFRRTGQRPTGGL